MRFVIIAIAAAFLLVPSATPSSAHHAKAWEHAPLAKAMKNKKAKNKKAKRPKVEYMRAVPVK